MLRCAIPVGQGEAIENNGACPRFTLVIKNILAMNQKGFLQLILVIIIGTVVVIAGGGFWYYQQSAEQNKSAPETQAVQETSSNEKSSAPTEQPKPQTTEAPKPADKSVIQEPAKDVAEKPPTKSPTPAPVPSTCDLTPRPKRFNKTPYYTGPLFDAHFHMPLSEKFAEKLSQMHGGELISDPVLGKDVTLEEILCFFNKEKVRGAIGFYGLDPTSLGDTLEVARNIKEESLGSIALFLMPTTLDAEKLDSLHQSNAGLFKGYGELAFYTVWLKPLTPSDPKMFSIYDVAEKHGLTVMMHPDARQENSVGNAARKKPNVKFLIHGPEMEDSITDLMNKYPNVYYSIDAILIRIPPSPGGLLYTSSNKEDFISTFTENFDVLLNRAVKDWKEKIEQHPDRFMWGTDRAHKWHYDEEVSVLLEEFARAFIARLDLAVQENYAYKNAESLIRNK